MNRFVADPDLERPRAAPVVAVGKLLLFPLDSPFLNPGGIEWRREQKEAAETS